jgi:hypothetical protein
MGVVEILPEARLTALFKDRANNLALHVGNKEFHRIGANIDNGAPRGFHSSK